MLDRGERYGLDLVRELSDRGLVAGEGTVYPLLSRLRGDGLVKTTWQESATGPPRRYYQLTSDGRDALNAFRQSWWRFRDDADELLRPREYIG